MSTTTLERVETPRLVCERLRMEHLPEISPLLRDPQVAEWLWPHGGPSEQDVIDGTRQKEDHWERYGFGIWLLRDIGTGKAVGWGGLQWTYVAELDEVEVAWAITPERWRQGLATEMAQAAIASAFGPLGLREIIAFTLPNNIASRRVMEKSGFLYEGEIVHALLPHVLYRRRADHPGAPDLATSDVA
ncbi:MAG TPA: GNAT family N-acetyltransferase [Solirubrobacteraceae bacterium]|nr:GNAT family N-acetyltransferase [Solirubrobacteraceae bacterium]